MLAKFHLDTKKKCHHIVLGDMKFRPKGISSVLHIGQSLPSSIQNSVKPIDPKEWFCKVVKCSPLCFCNCQSLIYFL